MLEKEKHFLYSNATLHSRSTTTQNVPSNFLYSDHRIRAAKNFQFHSLSHLHTSQSSSNGCKIPFPIPSSPTVNNSNADKNPNRRRQQQILPSCTTNQIVSPLTPRHAKSWCIRLQISTHTTPTMPKVQPLSPQLPKTPVTFSSQLPQSQPRCRSQQSFTSQIDASTTISPLRSHSHSLPYFSLSH